jgi:Transposase
MLQITTGPAGEAVMKVCVAEEVDMETAPQASTLYREIALQGFTGSYAIVRKFVEQYRSRPDRTRVLRPPSVRQVTGWICRCPDNLVGRDTEQLQQILEQCSELRSAVELVRAFADMMTHLHGERLTAWIIAAEQAALTGISRFAMGSTADLAPVTAGLSLPFSSGPVEGNVNRIKMIKRQMYGRSVSSYSVSESCWQTDRCWPSLSRGAATTFAACSAVRCRRSTKRSAILRACSKPCSRFAAWRS